MTIGQVSINNGLIVYQLLASYGPSINQLLNDVLVNYRPTLD